MQSEATCDPPLHTKNFFHMDSHLENQERHVLIINTGERRAYALEAAAYSIGRDSTNAIVIDFETVSRQHALLLRVPNPNTQRYEYRIIDGNAEGKESANGLFINGERIKSQTLKNGDSVQFGAHVKAAYLTLSMGEAEFVNYLESISYQSLKSELVDSKATMVGVGFDEMFQDTPPTTAKATPAATQLAPQPKRRTNEWQRTLHDSEKVELSLKEQGVKLDEKQSSPFKLWMAIASGGVAIALMGGFLIWNSQKTTSPEPTAISSPIPSSVRNP